MPNYWFKPETVTFDFGGRPMTIETGRLAKQAAGAPLVTYAALAIWEIPFLGPSAAVRMGRAGDRWIINPTPEESEASDIDLVVCGSRGALVMVEGGAKQVPEPEILAGLKRAHQEIVA